MATKATSNETDGYQPHSGRSNYPGGRIRLKIFNKRQDKLHGRRKKTKYYCHEKFSKQSILFLALALFQGKTMGDIIYSSTLPGDVQIFGVILCASRSGFQEGLIFHEYLL